jgi:hypothetical protein
MANQDQEIVHHSFGWSAREPDFSHDAVLAVAYAISEYAIIFVGPWFWMCLILLFLVAELRG